MLRKNDDSRTRPDAAAGGIVVAPASNDERRAEPRIPHRAVIVMPFGDEIESRFETAQMLDCSLHGIGVLLQRPLRPRTRFFVKLRLSNVALVIYEVKHCSQTQDGYRIGADFHGVIGNDTDRNAAPETVLAALLKT
jgi:hypothetical protein